jgi:RNA polymerase sigma-70 factor, ECF subfamily
MSTLAAAAPVWTGHARADSLGPAMARLWPPRQRRHRNDEPLAGDDARLVAGLRTGDEAVFAEVLERFNASLLRVAGLYVRDRAVAEEVVQETWLAVLKGIDRFEERSSLKTWLFRILTNRAKTRGARESRTVPFSSIAGADAGADEPAVDPSRFATTEDEGLADRWSAPPRPWERQPEERLLAQETLAQVRDAIEALPESQREVIRLRDVEGFGAQEVCELLDLSDVNQRVLLHRARAKVREALEDYFTPEDR